MRVLVFLKTIPDPEAPAEAYRFEGTAPDLSRVSQVLGPFEQNALELAVQLAEATGGELVALAEGGKEQEVGLRRALAVGAVRAVRVPAPEGYRSPLARARRLREAAERLGPFDVYVFGRQAGDWDQGVTAGLVAGLMGVPFVPFVRRLAVGAEGVTVVRELPAGEEEGRLCLPAVLSVTNSPETLLRIAKVRDVMMANRKPIDLLEDVPAPEGALAVEALAPSVTRRSGRKVTGSPAEVAAALVGELERLGVWGGGAS